jgi:hypothetical protein
MKPFAALPLATVFATGTAAALDYNSLARHYPPKEEPDGFPAFSQKHDVDRPNTCAVRLPYALFLQDKTFFRDVTARSGIEWLGLVVRADDLAIILNGKRDKAKRHESPDSGTGHISLWDSSRVVDQKDGGSDFFHREECVYFRAP